MYDKDDHFGRWVQLACAIPLLLIGSGILYFCTINYWTVSSHLPALFWVVVAFGTP